MSDQTPAGWYDNPERPGTLRYWDGTAWTDHVHEQQPAQPAPPSAPSALDQTYIGAPPPQQPAYGYAGAYAGGGDGPLETPGFIGAFKDAVTTNYAKFDGRTSVGGYWRFVAINIAISIVLAILGEAAAVFSVLGLLVSLALFIPGLAAGVRRLHDTGRSGWWLFILLIPLVGAILLIVWLATGGNPGPNQYGAPPRQGTA